MTTEITSVTITKDYIALKGINLDNFLFCDDLDENIPDKDVCFVFDRQIYQGAQMKYLYKLVKSQKACQNEKTMAGMLNKLCGQILNIPGSFLQQDPELINEKESKSAKKKTSKRLREGE